jgi:DeoR/GlpR family transcriptional regulator of sugar metabolism
MLVKNHRELNKLRDSIRNLELERKNKIASIVKSLVEIVVSYSANLRKLSNLRSYARDFCSCSACMNQASHVIEYDRIPVSIKGFEYCREIKLCHGCHCIFGNELYHAKKTFISKKLLTKEISPISDIGSYIFELYLRLYRETEL